MKKNNVIREDIKMTELQAIKISIDLWKWLNKNPLKKKEDYPKYKINKIYKMKSDCPCCEFYNNVCDGCPLCVKIDGYSICKFFVGLFHDWEYAFTEKESKRCSGIILGLLEEKYYKIKRGGK